MLGAKSAPSSKETSVSNHWATSSAQERSRVSILICPLLLWVFTQSAPVLLDASRTWRDYQIQAGALLGCDRNRWGQSPHRQVLPGAPTHLSISRWLSQDCSSLGGQRYIPSQNRGHAGKWHTGEPPSPDSVSAGPSLCRKMTHRWAPESRRSAGASLCRKMTHRRAPESRRCLYRGLSSTHTSNGSTVDSTNLSCLHIE